MKKHLSYLWYIVKHKWFVLVAGLKIGAPLWRLLIHDLSKFRPSEWFAYTNYFYGRSKKKITYGDGRPVPMPKDDQLGIETLHESKGKAAFDLAWLKHQHRNPHHWQFWCLLEDKNWWTIQSFDDLGPLYLAQNNERFKFPINIGFDESDAYKALLRLRDTLNARSIPQPMPQKFVLEMVADWMGAGRAITGRWEVAEWYKKNRDKMLLHPDTRAEVERLLSVDRK